MTILTPRHVAGLNLLGLILVSVLEAFRPGFVSGAVNVGLIWLVVIVSLLLVKNEES